MIPVEKHQQVRELGALSLILYFISSYEIAAKQQHEINIQKKSLVEAFLPSLIDNKIEWPIKKLTDYWIELFDIQSINKLAESMPAEEGSDIESKQRKLDYWRSGKNQPEIESQEAVFEWLESFCLNTDSVNREFVRFQTVLMVRRLFKFLLKRKPEQEWLVKAFDIYRVHYKDNFNRFSG